jgi:hypothetical protein
VDVLVELSMVLTQYAEEPDNYFVEITKDLLLKMRNIKIYDCDEIPTEVKKVFSTVKEVIGLDGGCGRKIRKCIIGFVIKYQG